MARAASVGRPLPRVRVVRATVASGAQVRADHGTGALAVPVAPPASGDRELQPRVGAADAAARYGIDLAEMAERHRFTGAAGTVLRVDLPRTHRSGGEPAPWEQLAPVLFLVGVGAGTAPDLRRAGAAMARAVHGIGTLVSSVGAGDGRKATRALVEGYLLGSYTRPRVSGPTPPGPVDAPDPVEQDDPADLVLLGRYPAGAVEAARVTAEAVWAARDLTNTPSDVKTPAWTADRITALAAHHAVEVTVRDADTLAADGMRAVLAVGSGSATPPCTVTVHHPGDGAPGRPHVVLVGKGVTFDTGGISLKPTESMALMRTDMAGAAVVACVAMAAADMALPVRVTAVAPLAVNALGAASYRPGDVIRCRDGHTVEVLNTDAEGRLLLADALGHAVADLEPDVLVDVATLTGAATVALGRTHAALYSTDADLSAALAEAGRVSGEPAWPMPLVEEYRSALDSPIADLCQVARDGNRAGSIAAALFLREFTGRVPWAHLDIAGPARAPAPRAEVPEGATGYGVRLLLRWLEALADRPAATGTGPRGDVEPPVADDGAPGEMP